jgi:mRNA-degrading endonuclease YafQ of YafQ-DinJ toxin-antitoxin module
MDSLLRGAGGIARKIYLKFNYNQLLITFEYRLVFKFIVENKVLLIDIGTHDEVY